MSKREIYNCDICEKEVDNLYHIVVQLHERKVYDVKSKDHYRADFDVCLDCAREYKLIEYQKIKENIEFVKKNGGFLSKIWKRITGDE